MVAAAVGGAREAAELSAVDLAPEAELSDVGKQSPAARQPRHRPEI